MKIGYINLIAITIAEKFSFNTTKAPQQPPVVGLNFEAEKATDLPKSHCPSADISEES